jgi:uncharacterized lipoprotein YajG
MRSILAIFFFLALSACGRQISETITVPHTEPLNITGYSQNYANKSLKIERILDERKQVVVTTTADGDTKFVGSATGVVQDQLTQLLKGKGFKITNNAKAKIKGSIRQWTAEVVPGINGSVDAVAVVRIDLLDGSGRRVYGGVYEGSSYIANARINDQDLRVALGAAMLEAVEQAGSDQRLLDLASTMR